jgi:predicted dehydrogenase
MDRIQLAIVGCGGMGGRHLLGLGELQESGMSNVDLVAVCDLRQDNAEGLADDAAKLLGKRPLVFGDMAKMVAALPHLAAVDITTDAGSHHRVACAALDLGLNVLCEKPLALTIRGCNRILEAQKRSGKMLSVAENYRRDPLLRLSKALLQAGVLGQIYTMFEISAGSGDKIIILPWRHYKNVGGIVLDMGVHHADVMQYLLGDIVETYGKVRLYEKIRRKGEAFMPFYARWQAEIPAEIEATAEDALFALATFRDGTVAQYTAFYAGHGEGFGRSAIYGSKGSMKLNGARSGVPPVLKLDDKGEVTGDALLDLVPDFRLDGITARLFGGERIGSYSLPGGAADRKLLAIEIHELADCLLNGKTPEVDGLAGRSAMAAVYAICESSMLNRPVTVAEIEAEETGVYEAEINAHLHI